MTTPLKAVSSEIPLVLRCDGKDLLAILHANGAASRSVGVVVVVGGPQYRVGSHRQFLIMARDLARAGYPVLRFDYRGMGDSEGEPRSFETVDADIRAAVDALVTMAPSVRRVVLWGLCDAASASLLYCMTDRRVAGLILANPWVRTAAGEARSYLHHYYWQRVLQRSFWRKVLTGGFRLGKSLREFAAAVRNSRQTTVQRVSFIERMKRGLCAFTGNVLVIISGRDLTAQEFVDLSNQDTVWRDALARSSVRVERIADADHTFSNRAALDRATETSRIWLEALQ